MTSATNELKSTIMPTMRYRDAKAAIEWLCSVFGFEQKAVYDGPNGSIAHAELTLGAGMIMLGSQKDDEYGRGFKTPQELGGVETRSAYIVVADADAVHARAVAAGGTIVRALQNTDYGSREFSVKDPEGHSWSVGTYDPWAAGK
ncbi:MAG TPA: VOC family protein [Terracidiphilus sp.]|nr:VOC family protein [Terracidiphilus sp.]